MNDTLLYNVLGQTSFVILNKALNRALGANESMLVSFLIDKRNFSNGADFYYTIDNLCYDTALGEKAVRTAMKSLMNKGVLIKKAFTGLPPKQYYNINMQAIVDILSKPIQREPNNHSPKVIDNTPQMDTFNPSQMEGVKGSLLEGDIYNKNIYNKNKENKNKEIKTQIHVQNGILHDFDRENKTQSNPLPKPSENETPSKRGRQGDLTLFESLPKSKGYTEEFEAFWSIYRKHNVKNKSQAYEAYGKALRSGASHTQLLESIKKQIEIWEIEKRESCYTPHCSTWLNRKSYNDDFEEMKEQALRSKALPRQQSNVYAQKEKRYSEDGYELDEKGHRINPDPTNNFFCPHGFYDNREEYLEFIDLFPEGRNILDPEVEKADKIIEQNWLKEKARRREEKKRLSGS